MHPVPANILYLMTHLLQEANVTLTSVEEEKVFHWQKRLRFGRL